MRFTNRILLSALLSWAAFPFLVNGEAATAGFDSDGVDRDAPDFVTASLLVMGPGDELYSCAGHAALRMECPTYGLDYCFSYESESVKDKVLTFFRGKLKMGMFAVPTEEYLKMYRETGRGVMQYTLNLPPKVETRLWQLLDAKVAEGAELPYDHLKRGCAQSLLNVLQAAISPSVFMMPPWPKFYEKTQREVVDASISPSLYPWQRFFLTGICGVEVDRDVPPMEKIMTPAVLLDFLRTASLSGMLIIDSAGVELLPQAPPPPKPCVTPMGVSCLFVALATANWLFRFHSVEWLLLVVQTLVGLFFSYLVFVSDLPATSWHWLVMPFNPLPALFWRWRWKWALGFALLLLVWVAAMALAPHRMTDPAYLVLVTAYAVFYLSLWKQQPKKQ